MRLVRLVVTQVCIIANYNYAIDRATNENYDNLYDTTYKRAYQQSYDEAYA